MFLVMDASESAHLFQKCSTGNSTIGFHSRTFKGAEKNYTMAEKELLALVDASKRFEAYLYGRKFYWITDCQSATNPSLNTSVHSRNRMSRWLEILSAFDYDTIKKPGNSEFLAIADTLSRIPGCCEAEYPKVNLLKLTNRPTIQEIQQAQQDDQITLDLIQQCTI